MNFFADKYGEENIVSAVVHMDMTTPHLRLTMVPIVNGRLCSKDLFNRKNLSALQTELHAAVGAKYGLERGEEGSQTKHLDTAHYKAKMIIEQAERNAAMIEEQAKRNAATMEEQAKRENFEEEMTKTRYEETMRWLNNIEKCAKCFFAHIKKEQETMAEIAKIVETKPSIKTYSDEDDIGGVSVNEKDKIIEYLNRAQEDNKESEKIAQEFLNEVNDLRLFTDMQRYAPDRLAQAINLIRQRKAEEARRGV